MVKKFAMESEFLASGAATSDAIDSTLASIKIVVNGENIASYTTSSEMHEDHLEIPTYYVSEWIAENWWPLLWEPRKSDKIEEDDPNYRFRHGLRSAEHGFALPILNIAPTGKHLQLFSKPRESRYADARFTAYVDTCLERSVVAGQLAHFVDATVARLNDTAETPLQSAWRLVKETDEETRPFCELMGCLGLSPYSEHPALERALDAASHHLTHEQLLDLCMGATAENLVVSAFAAVKMHLAIKDAAEIDLAALPSLPKDQIGAQAWRHGYRSASVLRGYFGLRDRDIHGASAIFKNVGISAEAPDFSFRNADLPVVGETLREGPRGRMVLAPNALPSRLFAAARAIFFFLSSGERDYRLLTDAATRDQQASRAFAAELLVPRDYLREHAPGQKLPWSVVHEVSELTGAALDVVKFQASNCGLTLVAG